MEEKRNNQEQHNSFEQSNLLQHRYDPDTIARTYSDSKILSETKKNQFVLLIVLASIVYVGLMIFGVYARKHKAEQAEIKRDLFKLLVEKNLQDDETSTIESHIKYFNEIEHVSTIIEGAIFNYQAENHSYDLSGLEFPSGTLRRGFVSGSPLYDKLKLNYNVLAQRTSLTPDNFYIEFVNDGGDGRYKIYCDLAKKELGMINGAVLSSEIFVYNPENKKITKQSNRNLPMLSGIGDE